MTLCTEILIALILRHVKCHLNMKTFFDHTVLFHSHNSCNCINISTYISTVSHIQCANVIFLKRSLAKRASKPMNHAEKVQRPIIFTVRLRIY